MKTAHDLVAQAKSTIREVALQDAQAAIQQADVLIENNRAGAMERLGLGWSWCQVQN